MSHDNFLSRQPLTSGMAVAGLLLSMPIPLFGIIVSTLALKDIKTGARTGRSIASWGVVLGWVGLLAGIAAAAVAIYLGFAAIISFANAMVGITDITVPAPVVVAP